MARVKISDFTVDAAGNTISTSVAVRNEAGSLVTLYAAETGVTQAYSGANPFTSGDGTPDKVGYFQFWVEVPATVDITTGVGASATTTRRYLGDFETFARGYFGDGTAALPAISNVDDTNTGLFFPASDTVGIVGGGVERLRVTSTGRLGIGTTTPTSALHVVGNIQSSALSTPSLLFNVTGDTNYSATISANFADESFRITNGRGFNLLTFEGFSTATDCVIYSGGAECARFDATGLGIGTSSPARALHVVGAARITGLPTSSAGLSAGDLWNDSGTLKIV